MSILRGAARVHQFDVKLLERLLDRRHLEHRHAKFDEPLHDFGRVHLAGKFDGIGVNYLGDQPLLAQVLHCGIEISHAQANHSPRILRVSDPAIENFAT